jgi:hypothetical protein
MVLVDIELSKIWQADFVLVVVRIMGALAGVARNELEQKRLGWSEFFLGFGSEHGMLWGNLVVTHRYPCWIPLN